jgi:hypothetical protein
LIVFPRKYCAVAETDVVTSRSAPNIPNASLR